MAEHSGAPRLQGRGRGGTCAHRPFPGFPHPPTPGVGLLWGKARPGTSPVQLCFLKCRNAKLECLFLKIAKSILKFKLLRNSQN